MLLLQEFFSLSESNAYAWRLVCFSLPSLYCTVQRHTDISAISGRPQFVPCCLPMIPKTSDQWSQTYFVSMYTLGGADCVFLM